MPAGSEREERVPDGLSLPHTWRPLGALVVGLVFGAALVVVCAVAWFSFDAETRAKFTFFQRSTLVFLGLLCFAAWHALIRSRVVATDDRLVVVNGYRRREYEWAEIVAVHLPPRLVVTLSAFNRAAIALRDSPSKPSNASRRNSAASRAFSCAAATPLRW